MQRLQRFLLAIILFFLFVSHSIEGIQESREKLEIVKEVFGDSVEVQTFCGKKTKLCSKYNIFQGKWAYYEKFKVLDPFAICPNTLDEILHNRYLKDQTTKWPCYNNTYTLAHFQPQSCHWLSMKESVEHLKGQSITLVGDSIMGQLYIALLCAIEANGYPRDHLTISYYNDAMLRPDMPCDEKCLKIKNYTDPKFFMACYACPKGIFYAFNSSFETYPDYWVAKMPQNTTTLVLSSGAWYNLWKKIKSPLNTYYETIDKLSPMLQRFIKKEHRKVFWIELPPMEELNFEQAKWFGWHNFPAYNAYAKRRLEPLGVTFVGHSKATASRKKKDANITEWSHLHWCNPGKTMIPEFIGTALFHLISRENVEKEHKLAC